MCTQQPGQNIKTSCKILFHQNSSDLSWHGAVGSGKLKWIGLVSGYAAYVSFDLDLGSLEARGVYYTRSLTKLGFLSFSWLNNSYHKWQL